MKFIECGFRCLGQTECVHNIEQSSDRRLELIQSRCQFLGLRGIEPDAYVLQKLWSLCLGIDARGQSDGLAQTIKPSSGSELVGEWDDLRWRGQERPQLTLIRGIELCGRVGVVSWSGKGDLQRITQIIRASAKHGA